MTEFSAELIAAAQGIFNNRLTTDMTTWDQLTRDQQVYYISLAQQELGLTRANDIAG